MRSGPPSRPSSSGTGICRSEPVTRTPRLPDLATGVPFFVFDRKYGAAGAQPAELLLQLLERAWADAHPLITVPVADGCTDDTCAV
jgi:hypothetical protein